MTGTRRACAALGVSRATFFRRHPAAPVREQPVRTPRGGRGLSTSEQQRVLDIVHEERFVDRAPRAILAVLLEEGVYVCSVRTMYRLLASHGEVRERRAQRRHPKRAAPTVTATRPNEAWVWDITKVRGPAPGSFFYLAVILDLFSRYVVAWTCQNSESAPVATALFQEATRRYQIEPGRLIVHADRGSAMKSKALAELFDELGIRKSHSRPRCSNDNPHMESAFKTVKYGPSYPGHFAEIEIAREFFRTLFPKYNQEHRHSAIAFLTPQTVFEGRAEKAIAISQAALDAAFALHPGRFTGGRPHAPRLPEAVVINPDRGVVTVAAAH